MKPTETVVRTVCITWDEAVRALKEHFNLADVYLMNDDGEELQQYPDYIEGTL